MGHTNLLTCKENDPEQAVGREQNIDKVENAGYQHHLLSKDISPFAR